MQQYYRVTNGGIADRLTRAAVCACVCVCAHVDDTAGVTSGTGAAQLVFSAPLTPEGGKYSIFLY